MIAKKLVRSSKTKIDNNKKDKVNHKIKKMKAMIRKRKGKTSRIKRMNHPFLLNINWMMEKKLRMRKRLKRLGKLKK